MKDVKKMKDGKKVPPVWASSKFGGKAAKPSKTVKKVKKVK